MCVSVAELLSAVSAVVEAGVTGGCCISCSTVADEAFCVRGINSNTTICLEWWILNLMRTSLGYKVQRLNRSGMGTVS